MRYIKSFINENLRLNVIDQQFRCGTKHKYPTMIMATRAAYHHTEFRNKEYDPYQCPYCLKYHIGRRKKVTNVQ